MPDYLLSRNDIEAAAERLRGFVHRTPVLTCQTLDRLSGKQLFFKCENFQRVGAFKFRGALNAVRQLPPELASRGVVTHSSGNHAQALALAAKLAGIPAYIVMPRTSNPKKRQAVAGYGGQITECEPTLAARETTAAEIQARTGATLLPPYDHPHIIAGQSTACLELIAEVPQLDAIIGPVGGGGLISGTALAARHFSPQTRVFASEPAGADDAARSKAAGERLPQTDPRTIADGLLVSLGHYTWPIVRDLVEQIFVVDDEQIAAAMRLVWERAKLLIEPSSAVPVAAVLADEFRKLENIHRVGVILTGGNVDLDNLPW